MEFKDGDEAKLNANLIAEAMYAQCDPNGNQYVLLDSLVDHRRLVPYPSKVRYTPTTMGAQTPR